VITVFSKAFFLAKKRYSITTKTSKGRCSAMKYLVAIENSDYFTKGKKYAIIDYIPENIGYIVNDDQGVEHGISYGNENFIEVDNPQNGEVLISYQTALETMKKDASKQAAIPPAIYNSILSIITSYYFTQENFYPEDCITVFRKFLKNQILDLTKYH